MASFYQAVMTNGGANLLAKALAGEAKIEFSALVTGDGEYTETETSVTSLQSMTALKNQVQSVSFSSIEVTADTSVKLVGSVDNEELTEGYYVREIGIYAKNTLDGSEAEPILYSLAVAEVADYMPPYNGLSPTTIIQEYYATVNNSAEVTISSSGAYALASDLLEEVGKRENLEEEFEQFPNQMKLFMIGAMPNYYARENLFEPNKTTITIFANTQVNINGVGYCTTEDITLSAADVAEEGKDVYIYACAPESGTVPDFVLSQNSTVPDGCDADTSRKIGGFHCLCLAVGTISGHTLSGYATADILPASVWDLKHRPVSEPEGMVYDEGTGRWYDIYLASWDGSKLVSVYGGTIADGISAKAWHGHLFKEKMGLIGKRLLWRHEFQCVAKGSNEQTNINGSADPGTTGGHVDSAGRRMISNIGLEDCCGALWQWVNDEYEYTAWATSDVSSNSADIKHTYYQADDTEEQFFSAYTWENEKNTNLEHSACNYNKGVDDAEYGYTYGFPRQARVGASWGDSSRCGSRALGASDFGSRVVASSGARGASEPRVTV